MYDLDADSRVDKNESLIPLDDHRIAHSAIATAPAATIVPARHSTALPADRTAWSDLDKNEAVKAKDDDGTYVICLRCSLKLTSMAPRSAK